MSHTLVSLLVFSLCIYCRTCLADSESLQDLCPAAVPAQEPVFINGLFCKNPSLVSAVDFKTSVLNHAGNTDNFVQSSVNLASAAEFPGLNTLGLSVARTDVGVGGMVLPHSHPRAAEILYVYSGTVAAGFIDTKGRLFQNILRAGDVMIFPKGLLHYSLNAGFELATAFSFLNSQNPGVVKVSDASFSSEAESMERITRWLGSRSASGFVTIGNSTLSEH